MSDWTHRDEWKKSGVHCLVVVRRHTVINIDNGLPDIYHYLHKKGTNRWCVYVYCYPGHKFFASFSTPGLFRKEMESIPFHGECTFFEYHYDQGNIVTSVQIGADYDHGGDERFTHMSTKEEAEVVFRDADDLLRWMNEKEKVNA